MTPRSRAQSETLGVILLTAVVVILVTIIGGTMLFNYGTQATRSAPTAQCSIDATNGNVTIIHTGGDALDGSTVAVVLSNESGQSRIQYRTLTNRATFRTGDTVRLTGVGSPTDVTVVAGKYVICEKSV